MSSQPLSPPTPGTLPPGFSLRPSTLSSDSDASLMHSLTTSVDWPYTLDVLAQWNHYEQIFFVIEEATQRAVAVSCVFRQGRREATIGATITRPEYRGRGFAYALIRACIGFVQSNWSGESGVTRVLLSATELGARVYRKLGFRECGRVAAMQRQRGGKGVGDRDDGDGGDGRDGGTASSATPPSSVPPPSSATPLSSNPTPTAPSPTSLSVSLTSSLPRPQWEEMVRVANDAAAAEGVDRRQVLEMQLLRGGKAGQGREGDVSASDCITTASNLLVATASATATTAARGGQASTTSTVINNGQSSTSPSPSPSPSPWPRLTGWLAAQAMSNGKWSLGPVIAPDVDTANALVDAALTRLLNFDGDANAELQPSPSPSPSAISVVADVSRDTTQPFLQHIQRRWGFTQHFTNELMEWRAGGERDEGGERKQERSLSTATTTTHAYALLDLSFM